MLLNSYKGEVVKKMVVKKNRLQKVRGEMEEFSRVMREKEQRHTWKGRRHSDTVEWPSGGGYFRRPCSPPSRNLAL